MLREQGRCLARMGYKSYMGRRQIESRFYVIRRPYRYSIDRYPIIIVALSHFLKEISPPAPQKRDPSKYPCPLLLGVPPEGGIFEHRQEQSPLPTILKKIV